MHAMFSDSYRDKAERLHDNLLKIKIKIEYQIKYCYRLLWRRTEAISPRKTLLLLLICFSQFWRKKMYCFHKMNKLELMISITVNFSENPICIKNLNKNEIWLREIIIDLSPDEMKIILVSNTNFASIICRK